MEEMLRDWLFDPTISKLVTAAIGILLVVVAVRFIQRSTGRYIKESNTRYRVRKVISFAGYLGAALVVMVVFSERLGGLHVAFGVAGAGIAFSLQEVIVSIAGWFAVTFASFYRTGDRVQLGGIRGDVIDIGVLRTTIMEVGQWVQGDLYNGRVVRVANSFVFKEPVFNYSGDFPFLWDEISVPIKYGSDYRYAREMLERVAEELLGDYAVGAKAAWKKMVSKFLIEDARVEPMVSMVADENWVTYTIRYVVDYKKRRTTKDQLFTRILEEVEASGGRLNIAGGTLGIVEAPVLDVRVNPPVLARE